MTSFLVGKRKLFNAVFLSVIPQKKEIHVPNQQETIDTINTLTLVQLDAVLYSVQKMLAQFCHKIKFKQGMLACFQFYPIFLVKI